MLRRSQRVCFTPTFHLLSEALLDTGSGLAVLFAVPRDSRRFAL